MEDYPERSNEADDEETYVLLDLDNVCVPADIPANASYVLSGLDTLNPLLVINDRLEFIGEYQETIGTCYVFTENVRELAMCEQPRCSFLFMIHYPAVLAGGSKKTQENDQTSAANSSKEKHVGAENKISNNSVKSIAILHKVLKFKLASESRAEEDFNTDSRDHLHPSHKYIAN